MRLQQCHPIKCCARLAFLNGSSSIQSGKNRYNGVSLVESDIFRFAMHDCQVQAKRSISGKNNISYSHNNNLSQT